MIKIYGMNTCPDCIAVDRQVEGDDRYEVIDIGAHVKYLKEFLRLRDNHAVFDNARKQGYAGIPCFVLEDGTVTLPRRRQAYGWMPRRQLPAGWTVPDADPSCTWQASEHTGSGETRERGHPGRACRPHARPGCPPSYVYCPMPAAGSPYVPAPSFSDSGWRSAYVPDWY